MFPVPVYSFPSQQIADLFHKATVSGTAFWTLASLQREYQMVVSPEAASFIRRVLEFDPRVFYLITRSDLKTIVL